MHNSNQTSVLRSFMYSFIGVYKCIFSDEFPSHGGWESSFHLPNLKISPQSSSGLRLDCSKILHITSIRRNVFVKLKYFFKFKSNWFMINFGPKCGQNMMN